MKNIVMIGRVVDVVSGISTINTIKVIPDAGGLVFCEVGNKGGGKLHRCTYIYPLKNLHYFVGCVFTLNQRRTN